MPLTSLLQRVPRSSTALRAARREVVVCGGQRCARWRSSVRRPLGARPRRRSGRDSFYLSLAYSRDQRGARSGNTRCKRWRQRIFSRGGRLTSHSFGRCVGFGCLHTRTTRPQNMVVSVGTLPIIALPLLPPTQTRATPRHRARRRRRRRRCRPTSCPRACRRRGRCVVGSAVCA